MARSRAWITTEIWHEPDWPSLDQGSQWLYWALLAQPDLSACGVIVYRPKIWAGLADGLTPRRVSEELQQLVRAHKLLVDNRTDEVLVRTFVRHNVLHSPNLVKAAARAYDAVHSGQLRKVIVEQFPEPLVEGFPEGFPKGLLKLPSKQLAERLRQPFVEGFPEGFHEGFGKGLQEGFGKGFREPSIKSGERIADSLSLPSPSAPLPRTARPENCEDEEELSNNQVKGRAQVEDVVAVLAEWDTQDAQNGTVQVHKPAAYRAACAKRRRAECGTLIAETIADNPDWAAEQIAAAVVGPANRAPKLPEVSEVRAEHGMDAPKSDPETMRKGATSAREALAKARGRHPANPPPESF